MKPMRGSSCFTERERSLDEPFFFYEWFPKRFRSEKPCLFGTNSLL
jgi:hypothetical protein